MIGTTLGSYQITGKLGEGGMGEVYRARDTRLKRDVAIKVLPGSFASDPERLARFEREAHVLAALNHPHIAHVYGFEAASADAGGTGPALVMELVEGQTLAERLASGGASASAISKPSIEEALQFARQIAEALGAAHERGIVHRDLKPANIKVRPDGAIKVLDFGLANWPADPNSDHALRAPTITSPAMTQQGTILGTASYMAPEQAKGQAVDKRADIWAFGCVLFEMLSGRRLFDGGSVGEVLAAVIKDAPDWTTLPDDTPAPVRRLLSRCLEKDPKRRLHDIADARFDIEDALQPDRQGSSPAVSSTGAARAARRPQELAAWIAVSVLALTAAVLAAKLLTGSNPETPPPMSVSLVHRNTRIAGAPQISPDGRRVMYVARNQEGLWQLFVRDLDGGEPRALAGTEEHSAFDLQPFWSPDSRDIGFFALARLRRISASGGAAQALAEKEFSYGGAWSSGGTVIYAPQDNLGLMQVSANGDGAATPLTTLPKDGAWAHLWPAFLPDGRRFLFTAKPWNRPFEESRAGIFLGALDSSETVRLLPDVSNAVYAEPGYILFARDGVLTAVPFDAAAGRITRDAMSLGERVTVNPETQLGAFSVSRSGVIALRRSGTFERVGQLQWMDRKGMVIATLGSVKPYADRAVSPDLRWIAASVIDPKTGSADIWILGSDGMERPLTVSREYENAPLWSPDSSRLVYLTTNADGSAGVKMSRLDGSEPSVLVDWREPGLLVPSAWSPNGRHVLMCRASVPGQRPDLMVWSFESKSLTRLTQMPTTVCGAQFSPDGKSVAYMSYEAGRLETFLVGFPEPRERKRIATGSALVSWREDGRELLLISADTLDLLAVPLTIGPDGVVPGVPTVVLKQLEDIVAATRDHSRLLVLTRPDPEQGVAEIRLLTGWREKLQ
jgi:serine/threonine protein kinase/Tol biopolymer transport system component